MESMHYFNTLHTHMKELDSCIFNFETSMLTSKYNDTSHMPKLKWAITIVQDQLKIHEKDAITWVFKLKEDGQAKKKFNLKKK